VSPDVAPIFDRHAPFDPAGDLDAFLKAVPAKWVVYLLADEQHRPVQLLCVKNLRYSLKRRLGGDEPLGPDAPLPQLSKRVDYRALVRHVYWTRVDSAFEADLAYLEAARHCFPQTYQGMVGFRPAWFVHVNPDAAFPRYAKTTDLSLKTGKLIGPIDGKEPAQKLVQLVEDAFDLCRYYPVLVEAPKGRACAYKEMGKCPAPCDGSISMGQYRQLVHWSVRTLEEPAEFVREQERRMQAAAAELRFETAAKVKQFVAQLQQLGKGPFRHAKRLEDFAFVSLQHGPRAGTAKVFLVARGRIEELLGVIGDPLNAGQVLRVALERAAEAAAEGRPLGEADVERVGIVTHHLFSGKHRGVFLRLDTIDEKAVLKGYRELGKQAHPPDEADGEGVLKELQSL
jgi:excinuclease UvrABC nuclease subunit